MARKTQTSVIEELQAEIKRLQKENEELRNKTYTLMGEAMSARRWAGRCAEAMDYAKDKAKEAERRLSNFRKWMEIKGVYKYNDPYVEERMIREVEEDGKETLD